MTTNQGLRHASFRAISSTSGTYNGDSMAAFLAGGATADHYNGAFIEWLQAELVSTDSEINGLKQAYARAHGADSWDGLGTFVPILQPSDVSNLVLDYNGDVAAASISDTSGNVTQWDDDGTTFDIVQTTGSLRPRTGDETIGTKVINAVSWDGAQTRNLDFQAQPMFTDLTLIVVHNTALADEMVFFASFNSGTQRIEKDSSGNYSGEIGDGIFINIAAQVNPTEIFTLTASDSNDELEHAINNAALTTTAYTQGTKSNMNRMGTNNAGKISDGAIGRMLAYDKILTATEVSGVVAGLNAQFGVF